MSETPNAYLDEWHAIETRKEAISKYAEVQRATLDRTFDGNIAQINEILIDKFGLKGLVAIKVKALSVAGLK